MGDPLWSRGLGDEYERRGDLGDGTKASERSVARTYNNKGSYTVTLIATDSAGQADTKSASIEVTVDRKALRFTGRFDLFGFENEPFEGEVETITPGGGQLLDLTAVKTPGWGEFTDNGDGMKVSLMADATKPQEAEQLV